MTPGPIERLKPYFKPRPRRRTKPQSQAPAAQVPPAAQPQAASAPPPAAQPQAAQPAPAPPRQVSSGSNDGLAARREQLARRYSDLQSDLGGLVYEMAIRDHFRLDVVVRRAAELQAVDAELTAVEQSLGLVPAAPLTTACPSCGAPSPAGSAFCGRCGTDLRPGAKSAPPTPVATRPAAVPPAREATR